LTWLAVVVFVIVELLLVLAIVLDAVIANHGVLAPVLEGALSTLVAAIVVYFAYFYARASMVRLSDAESARTRAEARVKELSENEHALLNATPASALLMDADEKILAINETGASMLGSSPEDLVGKSVGDFLPAAVSTDRIRLLEDVKGNSEGLDFTAAYAGKDYRHIVVPIFDEEGSVVRMAVYALDVTDQEEAESKVRESEERYRTLFETSFDGIVYTELQGRILACNQSFARMLGYDADELVGNDVWQLTPSEWHAVDQDVIDNQLIPSGRSDRYDKQFKRKDGSLVPVNMRVWVVYDSMGRPAGAWARVEDISERKQYEDFIRQTIIRLEQANDRLREVDRLKTEFVGVVSHELRAPLATVESGLVAMKTLGDEATPQQREELVGIVERGLRRLGRLVDDLLDITRIESGQLRLELQQVSAVDLVTRVMELYEKRFQQKGIELGLEHTNSERPVLCDSRRVEQVLTNLLDNAMKFTEDGAVVVRLESTPTRVICSVTDSGPGVPPGLQQQVFEKFFTGTSPDGSQGVGLGLAISRGIVEAHGGRMWVESRKGSGATFGFELPLVSEP